MLVAHGLSLIACRYPLELVHNLYLLQEAIFFCNGPETTEIYTLSLHDALPIYVAKYVNKKSDMDLAAKGLGAKEWNNSLKTKLSLLPKKLFRIRMSRNFGMKMLTMTNLSTECLIQLTKLGYDATPFNQI